MADLAWASEEHLWEQLEALQRQSEKAAAAGALASKLAAAPAGELYSAGSGADSWQLRAGGTAAEDEQREWEDQVEELFWEEETLHAEPSFPPASPPCEAEPAEPQLSAAPCTAASELSAAGEPAACQQLEAQAAAGGGRLSMLRNAAPLQSQELLGALLREVHSLAPEDALLTARSGTHTARSAAGPPNLARVTPLSRFQTEAAQEDSRRQVEGQLRRSQRDLQAAEERNAALQQQLQRERQDSVCLQRELQESRRQLLLQQQRRQEEEEWRRGSGAPQGGSQQQRQGRGSRACGCFGF